MILATYLTISILWTFYATYKTYKLGYLGKLISNQIKTFIINLILFPYCLFYAIKNNKI